MAYQRKTTDLWELQGFYGRQYGWECLTAETSRKEIRERLREYQKNGPGAQYRIVYKRVPIIKGEG